MESKTECENHSIIIAKSTPSWVTNSALLLYDSEVCVLGAKFQPVLKVELWYYQEVVLTKSYHTITDDLFA